MPRGYVTFYNWHDDAIHTNGRTGGTWVLKTDFGASFADGSISVLLAPPAAKEMVTNESRLENGKRIDKTMPTKFQSRELTLEMHIIASSLSDLISKYRLLINELTYSPQGIILVYQNYDIGQQNQLTYRLKYLSCTQFAVYNGTLAKFAIRFIESNPQGGQSSLSLD